MERVKSEIRLKIRFMNSLSQTFCCLSIIGARKE